MAVKNFFPLRFFTLPAFKKLNGELAKKLNISLDRNNIRSLIIQEVNNQKDLLKNLMKNKFCFLKDGCMHKYANKLHCNKFSIYE